MLKQRNPWFNVLVALLTPMLLLIACGPVAQNNNSASQPKFGGTVIDGIASDPNSLLPYQTVGNPDSALVDAAIWTPLFYGDSSYQIQPGLATEVPTVTNHGISSDFKTFTIHLRSGLKWSDGTPETVQDVLFTIKLWENPAYPTGFPTQEVTSITSPNSNTIVFKLNKVDVIFLTYLLDPAAAPLPQHVFNSIAPANVLHSIQAYKPTVDSGPFIIKDRMASDHITVVKNPYYFRAPKPYLDSVIFKILPDKNSKLVALESGTIDAAWNLDIDQINTYKAISGYHVVVDKTIAQQEMLFFNLQNSFLADLKVRKAITMGIDITPLMKNIWQGLVIPTCDDDTGNWAFEPGLIPCYKYDPAGARALLESDGFTLGSNGYFSKNGKVLELRWSATADQDFRVRSEEIEQGQLQKIGIKMDIVNYPPSTLYGSVVTSGNFDVIEDYYGEPYDPDDHILWDCNQTLAQGGYNVSRWCDPKVDQADALQMSTLDRSIRMTAFHTIHEELLSQLPVMFLYGFPNIACARGVLKNYSPMEAGPPETWNIWDWWRTDATGR